MAGRPSQPWFYAGKNTWYIWLEGSKVSLKVTGEGNKADAFQAWHKLMASDTPTVPVFEATVKEVIDAFLTDAEARVKPVTYTVYKRFCRFFRKDKGKLRADALTPPLVEAWARKPTWSSSTRHDALGILATAFRWAERSRLIARSPLVGIRKPPKASRGASAVISDDEHARLVAHADPLFGAYLRLLWLTGARPGEIAGLHAEEIDYAAGVVVLKEHKEAHLGKSRTIFLCPEAIELVKNIGREIGLLFPASESGEQMSAQTIGKRMRRLCAKAGIRRCTPYGYRHSFGTQALVNGVPDAQVAALLGHSGTTMLHKHYSHLTAQSQALREALGRVR